MNPPSVLLNRCIGTGKKSLLLVGCLLVSLACAAPDIIATPTPTPPPATPTQQIKRPSHLPYQAPMNQTSIGEKDAPVRIDVWEDFQCPACAHFSLYIEPQVIQAYVETGQALYTFHFFPFLDGGHPQGESHQAANAAMCAAEQGKFWEYHGVLMSNWSGENQGAFRIARLMDFARFLGLAEEDFATCLRAQRYADQIQADYEMGLQWGVMGTPSLFVNGVIVTPGYVPTFEAISQAMEQALSAE